MVAAGGAADSRQTHKANYGELSIPFFLKNDGKRAVTFLSPHSRKQYVLTIPEASCCE